MGKLPAVHDLIYDWNLAGPARDLPLGLTPRLVDETLRDGLQSPSVTNPTIEQKLRLLHLMAELGIQGVDIGLPGAGGVWVEHTQRLARAIVEEDLPLEPYCAARTITRDIDPIVEISEKIGRPLEVAAFIGSSSIRKYAEDWSLEGMVRNTVTAVEYTVRHGLPVMFVTEDTTRAHPETLRTLYTAAIEHGATRLCVCDTVGHVTPVGVASLLGFVKEVVKVAGASVTIDWHGHRDRSLDVPNSLAAWAAGADRVHGCALGIGERVGNTAIDLLLTNLHLMGLWEKPLLKLREYCLLAAEATGTPIPPNYPVVGRDAFRTGTGVHAAAVIKAKRKGEDWLADRVYSGVPAGDFGCRQEIEVGPVSGEACVLHWLETHGVEAQPELVERIYQRAKASSRVLTDEELWALVEERRGSTSAKAG